MDKGLWYVYTIEYYLAIKRKPFEPVPVRWMNLEPIRQSEVSQKEKNKYWTLTMYMESRKMVQMESFAEQQWGQT